MSDKWSDELPWIGQYILDEQGNPVPAESLESWSEWFSKANRRVAFTEISEKIAVSTVFLGLDHNWIRMNDPLTYRPILWETMIFGGPMDQEMRRYGSRDEALRGHDEIVELAKNAKPAPDSMPVRMG